MMSTDNLVAGKMVPRTWGRHLSFLRTKRAISVLVLLSAGFIAVIALAATHTIGGSSEATTSSKSNSDRSGLQSSSSGFQPAIITSASANSTLPASQTTSLTSIATKPSTTSTSKKSATSTPSPAPGRIADGTPLRIMCLGASIVKGETSPGTVGFRPTLRDDLTALGVPVNMVGSVPLGHMVDNDVEAYGGFKIKQIHEKAKAAVRKTLPNVFVINDGTNNVLQQKDTATAGEDMESFINYLLNASPRSFVVLSTLLTNTAGGGFLEKDILDINQQFRNLMTKFEKEGKPVVLAELHPSTGLPGRPIAEDGDIGPDGSHPTVSGYEKMGHLLAQAVQEGDNQGLLQEPMAVKGIADDGEKEKATATTKKRAAATRRAAAARRRHEYE